MFLETSFGNTGDRAQLISPILSPFIKCVSFYYHMKGAHIGTLNVYMKVNGTLLKRWTLSQEQGNRWMKGQIPVNVTGQVRELYSMLKIPCIDTN